MSRIIIIIQEKGGAGKSFLAVHLAHYLRTQGLNFLLADLDYEERLFARYDPGCKIYSPDSNMLAAKDSNFLDLVRQMRKGENILIDCGGNTLGIWDVLFQTDKTLPSDLAKAGTKITLVVPVSVNLDTQSYFPRYDGFFPPEVTKLMATVGAEIRRQPKFPAHPEELTITMPRMPDCLAAAVETLGKPAGAIAAMDGNDLAFPIGFARDVDRLFAEQFNRMTKHLKP